MQCGNFGGSERGGCEAFDFMREFTVDAGAGEADEGTVCQVDALW